MMSMLLLTTNFVVGKMLATCLVQGESPVCFAKAIADYIVFDNISSPPCIDDIPDFEIKQLLLKVHLVLRKCTVYIIYDYISPFYYETLYLNIGALRCVVPTRTPALTCILCYPYLSALTLAYNSPCAEYFDEGMEDVQL